LPNALKSKVTFQLTEQVEIWSNIAEL